MVMARRGRGRRHEVVKRDNRGVLRRLPFRVRGIIGGMKRVKLVLVIVCMRIGLG